MNAYRHTMVKIGSAFVLAAVLTVSATTNAEAAASLRLTQGATVITIGDGNNDGVIAFNGAVGTFFINVTTGQTKPATSSPRMILDSSNTSTPAGGTLKIEFTSTGYTGAAPFSLLDFSGFVDVLGAGGSIDYSAFFDPLNTSFGGQVLATQIATTLGPFSNPPPAFAASALGAGFGAAAPYSITQVVNITHFGLTQSSFNATLIPEPALLSLFGLGLAGFGIAAKRRRAKVQADGLV
jgi:hypothetical protein